jgi:hypothetical protein
MDVSSPDRTLLLPPLLAKPSMLPSRLPTSKKKKQMTDHHPYFSGPVAISLKDQNECIYDNPNKNYYPARADEPCMCSQSSLVALEKLN